MAYMPTLGWFWGVNVGIYGIHGVSGIEKGQVHQVPSSRGAGGTGGTGGTPARTLRDGTPSCEAFLGVARSFSRLFLTCWLIHFSRVIGFYY